MRNYDIITRILLYSEDRKQNELVREAVMMSGFDGRLLYADDRKTALELLRVVPVDLFIASIRTRRGGEKDDSEYRFLEEFRNMDLQKRAKLIISADMEGDLEYVVNQLKCDLFLTRPRLRDAMKDEIAEFIQLNTGVSQLRNLDRRFFFASGRKVYILQEHEILLYESTDKVGVVVTREQKLIVDVRDLRKKWGIRGSEKFVRCNPCDYVNIDYIREYDRHWLILEWVNNPVPVTKIGWENLERMRHLFIRND